MQTHLKYSSGLCNSQILLPDHVIVVKLINALSHKTQNVLLQTGREERSHTHHSTLQQTAADHGLTKTAVLYLVLLCCNYSGILHQFWHFTVFVTAT